MISINYSLCLEHSDSLIFARDGIFEAMFERAAAQLQLHVDRDNDKHYLDLHVDDLDISLAEQMLGLLEKVRLLDYVTVDVSTEEELTGLVAYTQKTTITVL